MSEDIAFQETDDETGITLKIVRDADLTNPVDGDDAVILCIFGKDMLNPAERHGIRTMEEAVAFCEANDEAETPEWVIYPVFGYSHGGTTFKVSENGQNPFSCPWDSGRAGWIALNVNEVGHETFKGAENVVKNYDDWASGNGFGYVVEDEDENELDACWGYLGDHDEDYIMGEAREAFEVAVENAKTKAAELVAAENTQGAGV